MKDLLPVSNRSKINTLKRFSLLPLAFVCGALYQKLFTDPELPVPSKILATTSGTLLAPPKVQPLESSEVEIERAQAKKYFEEAKKVFGCYLAGECSAIITQRLSAESQERANKQFYAGNTTREGRVFAVSMSDELKAIKQFSHQIPQADDKVIDSLIVSQYVSNNSWYDSAVEVKSQSSGLDYIKTFREFAAQGNVGDCDDTALVTALLLSVRDVDNVIISYKSNTLERGPFGHMLNAIKITDPTSLKQSLVSFDINYLNKIPVLEVISDTKTSYFMMLDATASNAVTTNLVESSNPIYKIGNLSNSIITDPAIISPLFSRLANDLRLPSDPTVFSSLYLTSISKQGAFVSSKVIEDPVALGQITVTDLKQLIDKSER